MLLEALSIHVSAMLFAVTAQVVVVAALRLMRMRSWAVFAFGLYMAGACLRECIVVFAGPGYWSEPVFLLSALSKLLQIGSAVLYIWAVTHERGGHRPWLITLALSLAFAFLPL